MEIIIQKPWNYTLSKDEKGQLILSVLCGSVGLFEIDIALNLEETEKYNKDGQAYIDQLAKAISYSPNDWMARKVNR